MRQIDNKFAIVNGELIRMKSGEIIPESEPTILFRAKDQLALPMLEHYLGLCINANCEPKQLESMRNIIKRFQDFNRNFQSVMKIPD